MSFPSLLEANTTTEERDHLVELQRSRGEVTSASSSPRDAPSNEGDRTPHELASRNDWATRSRAGPTKRTQSTAKGPSAATVASLEHKLSSMLQELATSRPAAQAGEGESQTPALNRRHQSQQQQQQQQQIRREHQGYRQRQRQRHGHEGLPLLPQPLPLDQRTLHKDGVPQVLEDIDAVGGKEGCSRMHHEADGKSGGKSEGRAETAWAVEWRLKEEVAIWKRKAEIAQKSYRQMMSHAQAAEQARMKQVAELALLQEERDAMAGANDAKTAELLHTREALEETRAELVTLKTLLRNRYHPPSQPLHRHHPLPQGPPQSWPFALSPTAPPPLLAAYAGSPETHTEAFAPAPTGSSSSSSPMWLTAARGWRTGRETEARKAGALTTYRSPRTASEGRSSGIVQQNNEAFRTSPSFSRENGGGDGGGDGASERWTGRRGEAR